MPPVSSPAVGLPGRRDVDWPLRYTLHMRTDVTGKAPTRGTWTRWFARKSPAPNVVPLDGPLAMLDRLHAGERPDYCLYLRPEDGARHAGGGLLSVDIEQLLITAFDPLPVVMLEEQGVANGGKALPDEAFLLLASSARILWLAPTADATFLRRVRLLAKDGTIRRCIFLMPEQGTLGTRDWPAEWSLATDKMREAGIELSGYTAGGWLFRLGPDLKACTFRPIVNPNPAKIATALEAICQEIG